MATNDILPFAVGVGANVVDQATYVAAAALIADGFQAGIAQSAYCNKVWRQGTVMAAAVARLIVNQIGADVLDNGDVDTIVANLSLAIQQSSRTTPSRVITSSANFNVLIGDGFIGMNRTAGLAATQATLPNGAAVGQEFGIQDLVGNFFQYPVTVVPPAGSIAGLNNYVINEDRACAIFRYYGANLWGVALHG